MTKDEMNLLYGLPYLQALVDEDIKKLGYIRALTLRYIGNLDYIIDKDLKVKAAK